MKKMLICCNLTRKLFYVTVDVKKGICVKKDEIDEDEFKSAMLGYILYNCEDTEPSVELEVQNRKFVIDLKEI